MTLPEPLHPNQIQAIYMQMFNSGQNAVWELGKPALRLSEWRDREIKRWEEANAPAL